MKEVKQLGARIIFVSAIIGTLNGASEEIGQAGNIITGSAEQSNVLTLNAAIEAARVGGTDRGFAIVADKVRA